jgi:LCP family protein required for cell wall assembly
VLAKHGRATALQNNLNALLVGLDGRHGTSRGRPDTILLLSFSEGSGQLGMVSIPRDLYIDIPGHGPDRINATYSVAQRQKQPPLELLKRVVEDTLQVPITHAISIDLNGFERVIDAIGGVDVKVPCPIADNFIDPRMPRKRRRLDVNAGVTHMDGVTAAMYVRSRHGRSDWSRARRQQAVLLAMQRRMLTPAGLARLPRWFDELGAFISTPMTRAEMFGLAPRLIKLRPERLHGIVLGHREARPHRTEAGKSVLLPDPEAIATRLAQLFSAKKPGTMPRAARCPPKDVALQRRTQTGSAAAMRHAIEKGSR